MINAATQTPILSGGHPIRGHSDEFRASVLDFAARITREGDDVTRFRVFQRTLLFTKSPQILQGILVDKAKFFQKSIGMRLLLYPLGGEGLFTSNGELWRRQRKTMAPIFQHNKLTHFVQIMTSMAEREAITWNDNQALDISKEMTRVTMGIVGKALFDADTFSESDELGAALTTALHWANSQALSLPLVSKIVTLTTMERLAPKIPARFQDTYQRIYQALHYPLLPSTKNKELAQAKKILTQRMQHMIDERKRAGLVRKDLLTTLLSARDEDGNPMSDQQVQDEAITLFVAGHETTATSLMWAFYLLAKHPDVYQKLLAEVDAFHSSVASSLPSSVILGQASLRARPGDPSEGSSGSGWIPGSSPRMTDQIHERGPTFEDLQKLPYSLQVFQETMRLYPPVPILSRQVTQDIEVGDYFFPARSIIFFSPYAMHRDPSLWSNPDVFDPDRFLPGEQEKRQRFSYLPFGGGPRVCIGNYFAMMEAQLLLAAFSRRATLSMAPGFTPIPHPEPTLRSQNGMQMIVKLRASPQR